MARFVPGRHRLSASSFAPGGATYGTPNLFSKSQAFDDAAWTKSSVIITPNNATAPDGSSTAALVADNNNSNIHAVKQNVSLPTSGAGRAAVSAYAKMGTCRYFFIEFGDTGGHATFDLQGGIVVATGGSFITGASISAAANGFYRCALLGTSDTAPDTVYLGLNPSGVDTNNPTYVGVGDTLYLWGAQAQLGGLGPYHAKP